MQLVPPITLRAHLNLPRGYQSWPEGSYNNADSRRNIEPLTMTSNNEMRSLQAMLIRRLTSLTLFSFLVTHCSYTQKHLSHTALYAQRGSTRSFSSDSFFSLHFL